MDWAEMLERMYLRWADKQGFRATIVDRSQGWSLGIGQSLAFALDLPFCHLGPLRPVMIAASVMVSLCTVLDACTIEAAYDLEIAVHHCRRGGWSEEC